MTEEVHYWTSMMVLADGMAFDFVPVLNLGLSFAHDTYYYVANPYYLKNSSNSKINYL